MGVGHRDWRFLCCKLLCIRNIGNSGCKMWYTKYLVCAIGWENEGWHAVLIKTGFKCGEGREGGGAWAYRS